MQSEIIKLAPTLSPKERAKLVLSDWHKTVEGNRVFNEAEQKAILTPKYGDVEGTRQFEYYFHLYRWANIFWRDDVEKTFLRFSLLLAQLMQVNTAFLVDIVFKAVISDINFSFLRNKRVEENFSINLLKKYEALRESYDWDKNLKILEINENSPLIQEPERFAREAEKQLKLLTEYKIAIEEVEKELDGVPLFDERTYMRLRGYWEQSEFIVSLYNKTFEKLEENKSKIVDDLKLILKNKEKYLVKRLEPDKEVVTQLIADVKSLVDSELKQFDVLAGRK